MMGSRTAMFASGLLVTGPGSFLSAPPFRLPPWPKHALPCQCRHTPRLIREWRRIPVHSGQLRRRPHCATFEKNERRSPALCPLFVLGLPYGLTACDIEGLRGVSWPAGDHRQALRAPFTGSYRGLRFYRARPLPRLHAPRVVVRLIVNVPILSRLHSTGVFNIDAEGITIRIPSTLYSPAHIAHASVKHAHRFVNRVVSVLWPVPPAVVALIMALFTAFVTEQPLESWWRSGPVATFLWNYDSVVLGIFCPNALCSLLPTKVRVGYLAAMAALLTVTALMLLQRLFLRVLLSYHGWMFERRRGVLTTLWGLALKAFFLGGRKPLMYR